MIAPEGKDGEEEEEDDDDDDAGSMIRMVDGGRGLFWVFSRSSFLLPEPFFSFSRLGELKRSCVCVRHFVRKMYHIVQYVIKSARSVMFKMSTSEVLKED